MTPLVLIGGAWVAVLVGAAWIAATRNPCRFDAQLPDHWRPHPRTVVATHHLTGGRSS